jgi:hypothetical protein
MDSLGFESREEQEVFLFSLVQIFQPGSGDHLTFCSFGTGILSPHKADGAYDDF